MEREREDDKHYKKKYITRCVKKIISCLYRNGKLVEIMLPGFRFIFGKFKLSQIFHFYISYLNHILYFYFQRNIQKNNNKKTRRYSKC